VKAIAWNTIKRGDFLVVTDDGKASVAMGLPNGVARCNAIVGTEIEYKPVSLPDQVPIMPEDIERWLDS
jgi:hypothetical protein